MSEIATASETPVAASRASSVARAWVSSFLRDMPLIRLRQGNGEERRDARPRFRAELPTCGGTGFPGGTGQRFRRRDVLSALRLLSALRFLSALLRFRLAVPLAIR